VAPYTTYATKADREFLIWLRLKNNTEKKKKKEMQQQQNKNRGGCDRRTMLTRKNGNKMEATKMMDTTD
jgi:hypothetical protein